MYVLLPLSAHCFRDQETLCMSCYRYQLIVSEIKNLCVCLVTVISSLFQRSRIFVYVLLPLSAHCFRDQESLCMSCYRYQLIVSEIKNLCVCLVAVISSLFQRSRIFVYVLLPLSAHCFRDQESLCMSCYRYQLIVSEIKNLCVCLVTVISSLFQRSRIFVYVLLPLSAHCFRDQESLCMSCYRYQLIVSEIKNLCVCLVTVISSLFQRSRIFVYVLLPLSAHCFRDQESLCMSCYRYQLIVSEIKNLCVCLATVISSLFQRSRIFVYVLLPLSAHCFRDHEFVYVFLPLSAHCLRDHEFVYVFLPLSAHCLRDHESLCMSCYRYQLIV